MRRPVGALLAALLLAGCPAPNPAVGPKGATPKPKASGAILPAGVAPLPADAVLRPIPQLGEPVTLVGRVRILSDVGSGLLSDNGIGVISNNSGRLMSNNGGGLVGKTRYALAQAAGFAELPLAEAAVEVLDAEGRVLTDPDGRALAAVTDASGNYALSAVLPAEAVVLRVRLFPAAKLPASGGQVLALVAKDDPARAGTARDLDTASTLGGAYVLQKYVQGRQAVLDKLPAAEAAQLAEAVAAAGAQGPKALTFQTDAVVAAAEALRGAARAVDARFEAIKAILLAGQANLGEGLPASQVALYSPVGVAGDGQGGYYVVEEVGRVRKIAPDGTITLFGTITGAGQARGDVSYARINGFLAEADGSLLLADEISNTVRRLRPGQAAAIVAGNQKREQGPAGGKATETAVLGPAALGHDRDGALLIGEHPANGFQTGRILRLEPDGTLGEVPGPLPAGQRASVFALCTATDGALWALYMLDRKNAIFRRSPEGAWTRLPADLGEDRFGRLIPQSGGAVLHGDPTGNAITRYAADGTATRLYGTGVDDVAADGAPAAGSPLNRPGGLWQAPDGTLLVCETGTRLVRRIGPDGKLTTLAGTLAATAVGDATRVAINLPGGLALDAQGRLLVAETGADAVKRLDGPSLVPLVGASKGDRVGPGAQARFDAPSGIARSGRWLYVADAENEKIKRVDLEDPALTVTTVAGLGRFKGGAAPAPGVPGPQVDLASPFGLAIGPDGLPYWTDVLDHQVLRLTAEGEVRVVAGHPDHKPGDEGDGGPAAQARLYNPAALAFDPKTGDLLVSDLLNMRVRRIKDPAGASPTIETFAGSGVAGLMAAPAGATAQDGLQAKDVALVLPFGLAFAADGTLYVSEAGTARAGAYLGTSGELLSLLPRVEPRIRRIAPDGTAKAVAGVGTGLLADAASDDSLAFPSMILLDAEGRLVVADAGGNQVKVLPKGSF